MLHTNATQISAHQTSVAEWFILFIQCFHCNLMMAELWQVQMSSPLWILYNIPADPLQNPSRWCYTRVSTSQWRARWKRKTCLVESQQCSPPTLAECGTWLQHNTSIRVEHHPSRWLQAPTERWMPRLPTTVVACSLSMWTVNSIVSDSQV